MNSEMRARIALAGYWIAVTLLAVCAVVIVLKLLFWPICSPPAPHGVPCLVGDSWTIAGVTASILAVAATVLAILGALAVATWWTGLEGRVAKQITALVEEQKQELYRTREALIYFSVGDRLLSQNHVTEARDNFHIARSVLHDDAHLNLVLGRTFVSINDYEAAIAALEEAQFQDRIHQANVEKALGLAYRHRWEDLRREEDYRTAEAHLKTSATLHREDSETFTLLGGLYRRKQHFEEALHWYKQAQQIDPYSSYTLGHIATLLWFLGRVGEAHVYFAETETAAATRIKKKPPEVHWYYYDLGLAQLALGKRAEAQEGYTKALQRTPVAVQLDAILEDLYLLQKAPQPIEGLDEIIRFLEVAKAKAEDA